MGDFMKLFNTNEVIEITGLRRSQINYLIRDRRIDLDNIKRSGKGRDRKFNQDAIDEIKEYYNLK